VAYGKIAIEFIIANKLTILGAFYILEKSAQKTKTTVDDSILTFLKNLALTVVGKGDQVKAVYSQMKDLGLVHEKLDGKTLQHLTKKLNTPKSMDMNKYPDKIGADVKKPMLNEKGTITKAFEKSEKSN